jgi:hypothetical protein
MDDMKSQLLWLATQQRTWRSLAVVPASEGFSTLEVANMFAKLSWWYRGQPSSVADFRDLPLRLVDHQLRDIAQQLEAEPVTIIIALRSIYENPTVTPVATAADAAILCVHMGVTKIAAARRTVEAIGRHKFLGTFVVRDTKPAAAKGTSTAATKVSGKGPSIPPSGKTPSNPPSGKSPSNPPSGNPPSNPPPSYPPSSNPLIRK